MKKGIIFYFLLAVTLSLYAEKTILNDDGSLDVVETEGTFYLGYGSKVSEVKFGSNSPKITKIILEGTAFIHDYSFIAECENLEVLVLNTIMTENLNLDFLSKCKKLRVIAFDGVVHATKLPNLANLENLEYFAMTNCGLTSCSATLKHGKNLKFINLCHNEISELPKPSSGDNALYFVSGNIIKTSKYKNYNFDSDIRKRLAEEFWAYIR
ncbi:MAG: hypothetical protein IJ530_08760 [Treponema sp.]|uniref:hypothetical protein n=1 Tax=Treponema sp. TaxID=166 RepID=UPI0025F9BC5F|nr:hypothetical protein [Treponema sp.]MBQ8679843.1 hypothetical protein [Treponema sp.]